MSGSDISNRWWRTLNTLSGIGKAAPITELRYPGELLKMVNVGLVKVTAELTEKGKAAHLNSKWSKTP